MIGFWFRAFPRQPWPCPRASAAEVLRQCFLLQQKVWRVESKPSHGIAMDCGVTRWKDSSNLAKDMNQGVHHVVESIWCWGNTHVSTACRVAGFRPRRHLARPSTWKAAGLSLPQRSANRVNRWFLRAKPRWNWATTIQLHPVNKLTLKIPIKHNL